jgi:hypothetical protein
MIKSSFIGIEINIRIRLARVFIVGYCRILDYRCCVLHNSGCLEKLEQGFLESNSILNIMNMIRARAISGIGFGLDRFIWVLFWVSGWFSGIQDSG